MSGEHSEHEDHGWDINIPDHPPRSDSPEYKASRAKLHEIVATLPDFYYLTADTGSPSESPADGGTPLGVVVKGWQDHHGAGLWLKDSAGWFFVRNLAGIEWSAQFCASPARVDLLRRNAQRLYAAFPEAVAELGIADLLAAPVTDAAGVAKWTDSICNASVPLPAGLHCGVLPAGSGVHHYPTPITDIETVKYGDFNLFVTDSEGHQAAVVPTGPRGSGDGRVQVLWANTGSLVHAQHMSAQADGEPLILDEDHELAKLAFAGQQ
jgi:hypothetical protein